MNRTLIDLHGLTETEAMLQLDAFLLEFDDSNYEEAEIITGNGIVLKHMAIDYVTDYGYNWKHERGNTGSIIIY